MLPHMDLSEARNEHSQKTGTAGIQTRTLFPDNLEKQKTGRKGGPRRPSRWPASVLTENGKNISKHRISSPMLRAPLYMERIAQGRALDLSIFVATGQKPENLNA